MSHLYANRQNEEYRLQQNKCATFMYQHLRFDPLLIIKKVIKSLKSEEKI